MRWIAVVLFVLGVRGIACADAFRLEPVAEAPITLGDVQATPAPSGDAAAPNTPANPVKRWGDANTFAFNVFAGYASDFGDIDIVPAAAGISWFPIRAFSIDLQAEGAYVTQPGPDAGGGGLALVFRWHFLDFETWSLYADLGIGFLAMSNDVPENAASFVFTPRAGLGASFALNDTSRILVGARWFHISNAQTASENPGINALQGYVGVSFGF
ncbi:MAG: acyloxyacyl hydrolase [Phycisphaerales bacterium]